MTFKQRTKEITKKIQELQEEKNKLIEKEFQEGCKEIFKNHPCVVSWSWTQYTPYFNDGDTCHFSVHEDFNLTYTNEDGEEVEEEYIWEEAPGLPAAVKKACKDIGALLGILCSDYDTALNLFGDHARVVVYRDKIEVEEYSHD